MQEWHIYNVLTWLLEPDSGTEICVQRLYWACPRDQHLSGSKGSETGSREELDGFPGRSDGQGSTCSGGDLGSIPGLGRCPGEGNGYPLQCSGLENSMDCTVHRVAESDTAELLSLSLSCHSRGIGRSPRGLWRRDRPSVPCTVSRGVGLTALSSSSNWAGHLGQRTILGEGLHRELSAGRTNSAQNWGTECLVLRVPLSSTSQHPLHMAGRLGCPLSLHPTAHITHSNGSDVASELLQILYSG